MTIGRNLPFSKSQHQKKQPFGSRVAEDRFQIAWQSKTRKSAAIGLQHKEKHPMGLHPIPSDVVCLRQYIAASCDDRLPVDSRRRGIRPHPFRTSCRNLASGSQFRKQVIDSRSAFCQCSHKHIIFCFLCSLCLACLGRRFLVPFGAFFGLSLWNRFLDRLLPRSHKSFFLAFAFSKASWPAYFLFLQFRFRLSDQNSTFLIPRCPPFNCLILSSNALLLCWITVQQDRTIDFLFKDGTNIKVRAK